MDILATGLKQFFQEQKPKERELGRFYASELYSLMTNRLTPDEWWHGQKIDAQGRRNIYRGIKRELEVEELLKLSGRKIETQIKKEYKIDDITIVSKIDFIIDGSYIAECKSSKPLPTEIKPSAFYQAEAYYRTFNLPVYFIYYLDPDSYKFFKYIPDDKRFEDILEKVVAFHKLIKEKNYVKDNS